MGNEKYLNYYIETLTSTMTDCVIRNVSMQANAKITDEVVKEQSEKIDELVKVNSDLQTSIQNLKNANITNENNTINQLNQKVSDLENKLTSQKQEHDELINKFRDYDSVKNQATHVDLVVCLSSPTNTPACQAPVWRGCGLRLKSHRPDP